VGAWWGAGKAGKITVADASGEGRLLVKVSDEGKVSQVIAQ